MHVVHNGRCSGNKAYKRDQAFSWFGHGVSLKTTCSGWNRITTATSVGKWKDCGCPLFLLHRQNQCLEPMAIRSRASTPWPAHIATTEKPDGRPTAIGDYCWCVGLEDSATWPGVGCRLSFGPCALLTECAYLRRISVSTTRRVNARRVFCISYLVEHNETPSEWGYEKWH